MSNVTMMLEVARRTGVSKAAVSRALSGNGCISRETRDRAFQAIKESGYRPNLLACNPMTKITQALGLVVTNISYHGVCFSELPFHTVRVVEDKGRQLLLADSKRSAEEERQAIQYLLNLRCDAIMIYPRFLSVDEMNDIIDAHSQPIMMPNRRLQKNSNHSVWCDQKQTSFNAVTQLTATGRKEIGFITGSTDLPIGVERLSSHRDALAHRGLILNNGLIVKGEWTPAYGAASVDISLSRKVNFTALVASNDDMAIGAMKQSHGYGVSVPAQVSVIGFDDIAPASYTIPALSSVRIPVTEMIQGTIGRLIFMLGNGAFTPSKVFAGEPIMCDLVAPPAPR